MSTQPCPFCGTQIPENSRFCSACGREIGVQFCRFCGAKITPNDRFCPSCGKELSSQPFPAQPVSQPKISKKGTWRLRPIPLAIIIVIMALCEAYLLFGIKPAEFEVGSLTVSPAEPEVWQPVTVVADVKNIGSQEGTYTATLKIDGATEGTTTVKLTGDKIQTATFTFMKDTSGSYNLEIGGVSKTVNIKGGTLPTYSINDEFVSKNNADGVDYIMTSRITGEDVVAGKACYLVEALFEPPMQGFLGSASLVLDKATFMPTAMGFGGEVNGSPITVVTSYSYQLSGDPLFPRQVGNQTKVTETASTTTTLQDKTDTKTKTSVYTYKVEGIEDITVAAGSFKCYKIVKYDTSNRVMGTEWQSDKVKLFTVKSTGGSPSELISRSLQNPPGAQTLIYEDDFSSNLGWWEGSNDWSEASVTGGVYNVHNISRSSWFSSSDSSLSQLNDFSVEVDLAKISGPSDSWYGLSFKIGNTEQMGFILVSPKGTVCFWKDKPGGNMNSIIIFEKPVPATAGSLEGARLRIEREGSLWRAFVNGSPVASVTDTSEPIKLCLEVLGNNVNVSFDNLEVYVPASAQITLPISSKTTSAVGALDLKIQLSSLIVIVSFILLIIIIIVILINVIRRRRLKVSTIVIAAALLVLLIIGIIIINTSTPTPTIKPNPIGPSAKGEITTGGEVELAQQSIIPSGGNITVDKPGDPLNGFQVEVPANSYKDVRTFQVSYALIKSHTFGEYFNPISPLIMVENGGGYSGEVILVRIPVKVPEGQFAMAFYYDDTTGKLEGIPSLQVDSGSITVVVRHFSWIVVSSIVESLLTGNIDSGFRPGIDDWEFPNEGSYVAPNGHCAGQNLTAIWYYVQKAAVGAPRLFGLYDGNRIRKTPDLPEDDTLAYRFASTVHSDINWENMSQKLFIRMAQVSPSLTFKSIAYSMLVTGEPQEVGVYNPTLTEGHDVIAYKVSSGVVSVADPNFPGQLDCKIEFVKGDFKTYESAESARAEGTKYALIAYFAKSLVVDWGQIDRRWTEFQAGIIGNDCFPSYSLKADDGSVRELKDGFNTDKTSLDIVVSSGQVRTLLALYRDGHWLGPALSDRETIALRSGNNLIGILISDDSQNWIDFKWVNIISSQTPTPSHSPTPTPTTTPPVTQPTSTTPSGSATVTIDSITHKLVKSENRMGNMWYWFDVEASGTASGPVNGYFYIYPYGLPGVGSGTTIQISGGWKQINGQTWQRTAGAPETINWNLISKSITLTHENDTLTSFNGADNSFEIRLTVYTLNQAVQQVVLGKETKRYTIPRP